MYLLTHSMEQSPSWEANRFVASQEIPSILLNPKVHCRIHKWPPTCPCAEPPWSIPYPHIPLPGDPFNIILPSTSCFVLWFIPVLLLVLCLYFSFRLFTLLQIYYVCLSPCLPIFNCCSVSYLAISFFFAHFNWPLICSPPHIFPLSNASPFYILYYELKYKIIKQPVVYWK